MRKAFDNPFEVQKEIPFFTTGLFAKPEYDKYRLSLARFSLLKEVTMPLLARFCVIWKNIPTKSI